MSFFRDLISMVSSYIQFEDANTKQSLINDNTINIDGDHEISYKEAAAYNTSPATITITGELFKEFQYFTGIGVGKIIGQNLKIIYIPTTFTGSPQISPFISCPLLETLGIFGAIDLKSPNPFGTLGGSWVLKNVIVFGQPTDILKSKVGDYGWFGLTYHGQGKFYDRNNQEINSITIDDNNFIISNGILRRCQSIHTIYGDNKVSSIGNRAFEESGLTYIDGLGNLTAIGENAFYDTSLVSITANNVTNTINGSFGDCQSLTTVHLQSVTSVSNSSSINGSGAFQGCKNLETVDIPNLATIGFKSFYGCSKLVSLASTSITSVGEQAFYYCIKLETFDTSHITTIGKWAFFSCSKFDSKNFNNVISIGTRAFYATGLTEVEFKNANFTTLPTDTDNTINPYGVFHDCTSLTKIDAPNITYIGATAFRNCGSLTTVTWDWDNITYIGMRAFFDCSSLQCPSDFSANLASIGKYAFRGCIAPVTNTYVILRKSDSIVQFIQEVGASPNGSPFPVSVTTVYVPDDLVSSYSSDSKWGNSATGLQFVGISQLPT